MLGVCDGVADHVLKEDLENAPGFLVDEAGDALDAAAAGQTADGGLGDALKNKDRKETVSGLILHGPYLDVVAEHLAVALGSSLSQSLASFAAAGHDERDSGGFQVGRRESVECFR